MSDALILRTRPSTVEARQLLAEPDDTRLSVARWVGGWTHGMAEVRWFDRDTGQVTSAVLGDWVVKTAFGHYKRVSDATIHSQYERVTP